MPEITRYMADKAYRRLDSALSQLSGLSRSRAQSLIEEGLVRLNGEFCRQSDAVHEGDEICCTLVQAKQTALVGEEIPLSIVYEDEDLCVINKPKGMVVHPAAGNESGTLVNALLYHFGSLSTIGGEVRPGIVHRIDKMTSGLLVVAKNDLTHEGLARQFAQRSAHRSYLALAAGGFKEAQGTVNAPIGRHPVDRKKMAVTPNGRPAVTHYEVLYQFNGAALLALELETGRTHQIRVHMAHIHHPLLGDEVYSTGKNSLGLEGQALHGWRLRFDHPKSGETLCFTAQMPEDMEKALRRLGLTQRVDLSPEGVKLL